jgi:hypothetical protein
LNRAAGGASELKLLDRPAMPGNENEAVRLVDTYLDRAQEK